MDIIRSLYRFSIFFNFFVFVLTMIQSVGTSSFYEFPVNFRIGLVLFDFEINIITLLFSILIIFAVIVALGSQLFGSGLNDTATKLLAKLSAYVLIWIVLSIFTLTFLSPLEFLGNILYVVLTIGYTLGFLQSLSLGGNDNE